jgi:hypothetical protein
MQDAAGTGLSRLARHADRQAALTSIVCPAHQGLFRCLIPDLLLFGPIEEILLENLILSAQVLADLLGQGSLRVDCPFERDDNRYPEKGQQPGKVSE